MLVNYTPLQSPLVGFTPYNHTRVSLFHTQLYLLWLPLPIVSAFLDSWQTRAMDLPTPSDVDTGFSRARLKDIAAWIRDDLDKLVARRGPDSLKPDDVLTLHDIFVTFRKSTTITASDLRASGIHKAIAMISDGTNRWPTRLCIECDKVISAWTAKFGEFNEIRPLLHGRGGRLEGIANATEFSRQVKDIQCLRQESC
jgi:hypothetical protein